MWRDQPPSRGTWSMRGRGSREDRGNMGMRGGYRGNLGSRGARGARGGRYKPWSTRTTDSYLPSTSPSPPTGKLISSLKSFEFDKDTKDYEAVSVKITNSRTVASYNWLGHKNATIVVPGKPPKWTPLEEPTPLKQDKEEYFRDPNAARHPKHPMEPAVMATLAMEPELPQKLDLVACTSTLGNLLRFVRGDDKTFRILVELVGDTVFFVRRENAPDDLIQDVRGYGHTFPESYTTWDAEVKGSASCQRLISYKLGGLDCLVRFEADGYIADDAAKIREPSALLDLDAKEPVDELVSELSRSHVAAMTPAKDMTAVEMNYAGDLVKQDCIFDLKTRAIWKKDDQDILAEQLPRMWIAQVSKFILAYHECGVFKEINIEDVSNRVQDWEKENVKLISRLVALIHHTIELVRTRPDGKLELRHEIEIGTLEILEQLPDAGDVLSDPVKKLWEKGMVGEVIPDGSNETSETAVAPESNESDQVDWDERSEPDYTACSATDCGYCGRCSY